MNILLIGNYGATNLGDEAILENILASHPSVNFTVFSHNPERTRRHSQTKAMYPLPFGIRSFFRGNFRESFHAIKNTDLVMIGGGGLFTDEKIKAILLWSWHFLWAKIYRKPVYFYANSIGPLRSKLGKFISKKVFQKANFITVRDDESAEILKKFGNTNFAITADPAFLASVPPENLRKKQVALSLRNWLKHEDNCVKTLKKTVQNLEKQGYRVLLISMQNFQDDDRRILNQISSEKSLIITPCDFTELIAILQKCAFSLGMRLHFLIASALANTPFVTLSYSQKTDSLAKNLAMTELCLPLDKIRFETLENLIQKILNNSTEIKKNLASKVAMEKQKAERNREIFELIFKQKN